jgi:hypothetical protein
MNHQQNNAVRQQLKFVHEVPSHWNSTFVTLERYILLDELVKDTIAVIDKNIPNLSSEKWKIVHKFMQVPKPSNSVTETISILLFL